MRIMDGVDKPPIIYGIEYQGRALASRGSLSGDFENIQFICGSQTLQHENKIHLVEYDEDTESIDKTTYPHPEGEIWQIKCSTLDSTLLTTSHSKVTQGKIEYGVSLWKLQDMIDPQTVTTSLSMLPTMEKVGSVPHKASSSVLKVTWNPSVEQLATYDDQKLIIWQIAEGQPKECGEIILSSKGLTTFACATWNPHHNATQIATGCGEGVRAFDIRSKEPCFSIEQAHEQQVRDIDFNPNKIYHFATCGDDCQVNYWDSRKTKEPLMIRRDHSHWVWSVRFNPTHDQLVLSSSSDSQVFLCRVPSVASEPVRTAEDEENSTSIHKDTLEDAVIKEFEEHEDSVYSVEWSGVDPWVFASLSYDGRLVINHVPNKEKFRILTI